MIETALFAVAILAAAYLLVPAFRSETIVAGDPRAALEAARAVAMRSLHDLELDWATGKLSDEDYQAQRAVLNAEAAVIIRRLRDSEPAQ
ncbi:MAG TPA: hypothetical protein VFM39_00215 [bacterium]|nr:hypothetical protein [bacterium]